IHFPLSFRFPARVCLKAFSMKIRFLGATRTVTGSRFLLEHNGFTALWDGGLFQGPREWKAGNWDNFPVDPSGINCVILTHAHIDHSGYLPRFIPLGIHGPNLSNPSKLPVSC